MHRNNGTPPPPATGSTSVQIGSGQNAASQEFSWPTSLEKGSCMRLVPNSRSAGRAGRFYPEPRCSDRRTLGGQRGQRLPGAPRAAVCYRNTSGILAQVGGFGHMSLWLRTRQCHKLVPREIPACILHRVGAYAGAYATMSDTSLRLYVCFGENAPSPASLGSTTDLRVGKAKCA